MKKQKFKDSQDTIPGLCYFILFLVVLIESEMLLSCLSCTMEFIDVNYRKADFIVFKYLFKLNSELVKNL